MGEKRDGKEVKVKAKKAKAKKAKNENGGEKKRNREIVGVDERAKSLGEKLGKGKVPKLEIELAESSETKRVSLGEPGCTPKIVHEVENLNTTPLAVREARAEEEAVAAARAAEQDKQALVKHTTSIAEMAEKRGGFTATKGGLALVGLVARSMAENPGVGVKNLYKAVCETVGCVPGKGAAPAAREVRKIMAALKDLKSLEAVMSSTKQFSNVGRRTELVMKKQKEGPKSEEGSCKLFMGNLSWAIKEDDGEEILKKFFSKCLKNGAEIKDIVKLKDAEGLFLGTGFIEFSTPEATMAALGLHGTECEGRAINLHFARARSEGSISRRSHQAPASELSRCAKHSNCLQLHMRACTGHVSRSDRKWCPMWLLYLRYYVANRTAALRSLLRTYPSPSTRTR